MGRAREYKYGDNAEIRQLRPSSRLPEVVREHGTQTEEEYTPQYSRRERHKQMFKLYTLTRIAVVVIGA